MDKPTVGQVVYVVDCGNNARYSCEKRYGEVVKVGRKYFTVKADRCDGAIFNLEDWWQHSDYAANFLVYKSEQDYIDFCESSQWKSVFRETFDRGNGNYCLEQYRQAAKVFDLEIPSEIIP